MKNKQISQKRKYTREKQRRTQIITHLLLIFLINKTCQKSYLASTASGFDKLFQIGEEDPLSVIAYKIGETFPKLFTLNSAKTQLVRTKENALTSTDSLLDLDFGISNLFVLQGGDSVLTISGVTSTTRISLFKKGGDGYQKQQTVLVPDLLDYPGDGVINFFSYPLDNPDYQRIVALYQKKIVAMTFDVANDQILTGTSCQRSSPTDKMHLGIHLPGSKVNLLYYDVGATAPTHRDGIFQDSKMGNPTQQCSITMAAGLSYDEPYKEILIPHPMYNDRAFINTFGARIYGIKIVFSAGTDYGSHSNYGIVNFAGIGASNIVTYACNLGTEFCFFLLAPNPEASDSNIALRMGKMEREFILALEMRSFIDKFGSQQLEIIQATGSLVSISKFSGESIFFMDMGVGQLCITGSIQKLGRAITDAEINAYLSSSGACGDITTLSGGNCKTVKPLSNYCLTCNTNYGFTNNCQTCNTPCSDCTLNENHCIECATNFLSNNSCVATCPAGEYGNIATKTCESCSSPCAECSGSPTSCTKCLTGFLQGNSCVGTCPNGRYGNTATKTCELCQSPCAHCSGSATTCTKCSINFLEGNSCITPCPVGKYGDTTTKKCKPCQSPCAECTGTSAKCTKCSIRFLNGNSCVDPCPAGKYAEGSTKTCEPCTFPCAECSGTPTTCTKCSSGFLEGTQCLTTCPSGKYGNAATKTCENCSSPCSECSGSASSCDECGIRFLNGNSCVDPCPSGKYAKTSTKTCQNCSSPCSTCSTTASTCTSCSSNYLEGTSCVSSCPSGKFENSSNKRCDNCNSPCSECSGNANSCTSCDSGYLEGDSCNSSCPSGKFGNDSTQTCDTCNSPCSECSGNADSCTSCETGYLDGDICVGSCPAGKFENTLTDQCQDCSSPCSECLESASKCTKCISDYFLEANDCLNDCPRVKVEDSLGVCTLCETLSYYFKSFENCHQCWVEKNAQLKDEVKCLEPHVFLVVEKEILNNQDSLTIKINPPLNEKLNKMEIQGLDFLPLLKLHYQSKENSVNSHAIELTKVTVDETGGLLTLEFDKELPLTGNDLALNIAESEKILTQTYPARRKDPKFIYVKSENSKIKVFPSGPIPPESARIRKNPTSDELGRIQDLQNIIKIDDIYISAFILGDPTGAGTKLFQMLKIVNRLIFINIPYGFKYLRPFLEICAKVKPRYLFKNSDAHYYDGFKARFGEYDTEFTLKEKKFIFPILYLSSWILNLFVLLTLWKIKKYQKNPPKILTILLGIFRKIKFSIFCTTMPDTVFWGLKVVLYSKTTSGTLVDKVLILTSLSFYTLDFFYIYMNIIYYLKYEELQKVIIISEGSSNNIVRPLDMEASYCKYLVGDESENFDDEGENDQKLSQRQESPENNLESSEDKTQAIEEEKKLDEEEEIPHDGNKVAEDQKNTTRNGETKNNGENKTLSVPEQKAKKDKMEDNEIVVLDISSKKGSDDELEQDIEYQQKRQRNYVLNKYNDQEVICQENLRGSISSLALKNKASILNFQMQKTDQLLVFGTRQHFFRKPLKKKNKYYSASVKKHSTGHTRSNKKLEIESSLVRHTPLLTHLKVKIKDEETPEPARIVPFSGNNMGQPKMPPRNKVRNPSNNKIYQKPEKVRPSGDSRKISSRNKVEPSPALPSTSKKKKGCPEKSPLMENGSERTSINSRFPYLKNVNEPIKGFNKNGYKTKEEYNQNKCQEKIGYKNSKKYLLMNYFFMLKSFITQFSIVCLSENPVICLSIMMGTEFGYLCYKCFIIYHGKIVTKVICFLLRFLCSTGLLIIYGLIFGLRDLEDTRSTDELEINMIYLIIGIVCLEYLCTFFDVMINICMMFKKRKVVPKDKNKE